MKNENFEIVVKTHQGLEQILASEINQLGVSETKILHRAVSFLGNKELLYRSNYELRTAVRVLMPITTFYVRDEHDLYKKSFQIEWENYFSYKKTFVVDSAVSSNLFKHSQYVALKVKDAIADRFREYKGIRPSVDIKNPDFRINLHVNENKCTISLDSSGDSLHKRGYKKQVEEAPLMETLAAGLVKLTGWNGDIPFIDPMCGSGTIAIEAAMLASEIPAGYFRKTYSLMNWNDFEPELWEKVKTEANTKIKNNRNSILGLDVSKSAIEASAKNVSGTILNDKILFKQCAFADYTNTFDSGILVLNPPYGERIQPIDINALYGNIGTTLKHKYPGFDAWIISSNIEAFKNIGLKHAFQATLFNGKLECRFRKYSLYSGTKKQKTLPADV